MAIFHFSVQVISRAAGRSAVAAAAYRAGERLHDERLDRDHDFRARSGVEHSEILLPEGAPERLSDRQTLWNAVEAVEKRKDAQLAREIEFAIPREMNKAQGIALARDFVSAQFVARGMIADLNVHWDIGSDGEARPHAHVMLSMREVGPDGFGRKVREWNAHENVERWRESWASHVNQRLAELDIDARIDHRSLGDQGIDLDPQSKIGGPAHRMDAQGLEADRAEMHREIARENGDRIIADPNIALDAITHGQASFTRRDLAMFLHRHSDGQAQFNAAMQAVRAAPDLIALGRDGRGEDRFTTRQMIETEQRLYQAAERMAERAQHQVRQKDRDEALAHAAERGLALSGEQRDAFDHVTNRQGLSLVIGYAGTGKSAMLGIARQAWEGAGFEVRGAALAGIAAEGLENGSGIASRTIASLEHGWAKGRDLLTDRDILVIDEAGMVGTRQMERVLSHAASAGAKVVLVGDPQQLQSIEAGAAFRALHERHGGVEITEVRRQHARWQQDATRHLATGRTGEAIAAYADQAMVHPAETREAARRDLVARWDRDRQADPQASQIILTHTNAEVRDLNLATRDAMRGAGALGRDVQVRTERGDRLFASGDRIMFLRNERSLEVKNGTLGTIEQVSEGHMLVRTDDARAIGFAMKDYHHFDHGYAATIHKAQGMTVDRAYVLATPGMDRHSAYVALSRHRDGVDLHYGGDEFRDQARLVRILSRERTKDMASDHEGGQAQSDDATMQARAFAERRGIDWRALAVDLVRSGARKARGLFDGLRTALRNQSRDRETEPEVASGPAASPSPSRRGAFDGGRPDMPPLRMADTARSDPEREKRLAVQRHARAVASIWKMQDQGLPLLPHQRTELDKARGALNRTVQYGASDMERAYQRDPALVSDAADGRVRDALQAMRIEADTGGDPREVHYYVDGVGVGDISNNGTSDVDYVTGMSLRTASGTGAFRNGATSGISYADFDQSYDPINGLNYEATATRYTVQDGDTIEGIALRLWGDASYWYLIAEANGLTGAETLAAGRTLTIPNKIHNAHNNSDVYRVYDPNEIIGSTSPSAPKAPKKNKCGTFGVILMVAVAVAVTAVTAGSAAAAILPGTQGILGGLGAIASAGIAGTAGATLTVGAAIGISAGAAALGSVVSQGIGLASGIQSNFSWKNVALSAIAGGASAGLGGMNIFGAKGLALVGNAAARGIVSNVLTQGIGVATGLQNKFNWAGVATAGIGAGIGNALGWQGTWGRAASGMAAGLAAAAGESLITGNSFGDTLMSSLPSIIGNTIGNLAADQIAGKTPGWQKAGILTPAQQAMANEPLMMPGGTQNNPSLIDGIGTAISGNSAAVPAVLENAAKQEAQQGGQPSVTIEAGAGLGVHVTTASQYLSRAELRRAEEAFNEDERVHGLYDNSAEIRAGIAENYAMLDRADADWAKQGRDFGTLYAKEAISQAVGGVVGKFVLAPVLRAAAPTAGRLIGNLTTRFSREGRMFSPGSLMGVEPASAKLLASVGSKRSLTIAAPGSDELRMLDYFGAEASVNTSAEGILNGSILLRENASKAAVLEEFLHGTQARLGVIERLGERGLGSAETHVKDFMIRHQRMLGLGNEDIAILKILRDQGL